jgi:hypothetical protein
MELSGSPFCSSSVVLLDWSLTGLYLLTSAVIMVSNGKNFRTLRSVGFEMGRGSSYVMLLTDLESVT